MDFHYQYRRIALNRMAEGRMDILKGKLKNRESERESE